MHPLVSSNVPSPLSPRKFVPLPCPLEVLAGRSHWDPEKLYVMSRDYGQVYALDMGLGGGEVAYRPEGP